MKLLLTFVYQRACSLFGAMCCALVLQNVVCTRLTAQENIPPTLPPVVFNAAEPHFPRVQYEIHQQFPNATPSNTASVLDAVSIAGRVCIQPAELAKMLGSRIVTKGVLVSFVFPLHTVSSAPDASFLAIHHHETNFIEIAQIAHPTVFHDGELYLPLEECLRVINESGVASVEQDESVITVHREETESQQESGLPTNSDTKTTIFIAPNDDSPSNATETIETSSSAPSNTASNKASGKFDKPTRSRYILPSDLKRRGMEAQPRSNAKTGALSVQFLLVNSLSNALTHTLVNTLANTLAKRVESGVHSDTEKKKPSKKQSTVSTPIKKPERKKISASTANLRESEKAVPADNDFRSAKKKWALDVIVLDAGHGGKDGGTVGVAKTKEKDVALAVVKKLGVFLKKELPGTKVVYTRTDDTFVELDRRGQIANENGGKLFVSIHCNATPKKPSKANGFEIYILRPGRNEDAVRIAEVENSVIKLEDDPKRYKPLTDEQFIVVSMAQSSFVKYSDMAAAMITAEVKKMRELGVRGVNQAGFLVLVGASMPNMLIETGFLSNKKEEKFLKSSAGQTKLALAICRAIKAFRVRYEAQIRGVAVSEIAPNKETTSEKISPKAAKPSSASKQTKKPEPKKTSGSKKKAS